VHSQYTSDIVGIMVQPYSEYKVCISHLDRPVVKVELLQNSIFVSLKAKLPLNRVFFLLIDGDKVHRSGCCSGNTPYFCFEVPGFSLDWITDCTD
jgi:hypothetical protein